MISAFCWKRVLQCLYQELFYHLTGNGPNSRPGSTESKMAADQSTDSTESVAVILDVDAETTLGKSFDRTKIKKR